MSRHCDTLDVRNECQPYGDLNLLARDERHLFHMLITVPNCDQGTRQVSLCRWVRIRLRVWLDVSFHGARPAQENADNNKWVGRLHLVAWKTIHAWLCNSHSKLTSTFETILLLGFTPLVVSMVTQFGCSWSLFIISECIRSTFNSLRFTSSNVVMYSAVWQPTGITESHEVFHKCYSRTQFSDIPGQSEPDYTNIDAHKTTTTTNNLKRDLRTTIGFKVWYTTTQNCWQPTRGKDKRSERRDVRWREIGGGDSGGERSRDVLAQSTTTNKTQQTTLCLFCELDQTNNVPILSCKHFPNQIHQIWRLLERRRNNSSHFTNLNYSKGVVYWKWNFIVYASRKLKSPTQVLASCAAENLHIRLYILPTAKPGQF